ncbi:sigma-70 family RNA polymerase sigma factor [Streptomyces sp. NBC_01288]|uniref:sigma-70 family RNA polymerase sigma factor n=1 Tax=Streptomyces sp. NBC_01288 TaxID=2903814 RepID=UPI002E139275|nr:sigma-70 family RNA polymerase sigma factor [Streptomyces sp. NBC_01288]
MTEKPRSGPDAGVVTAACAGDRQALDHLLTQCLPLVYNIVGRALNGHADVDDVVQETLLRMVRGLPKLRDPAAFRSWLVAITIRQVRDREQIRAADRDRRAHLEDAEAITDPALDFAGLTILRLGLTEQRREVVEATRWLDPDDQELLSLWWLEETGELERAELAGALGLSDRHASVRVQRMKKQMEVSRVVVRALVAAPRCTELDETASTWDGTPSALWRKRFARHIRGCGVCQGLDEGLLPMDRLLSGLPLVAVPTGLDPARVLNAFMGEGGSSSPADQPVHSAHRGTRRRHGRRSGRSGRMGKQIVGGSAAVAVVVVAALVAPRLTGGSSSTTAVASPAPVVSVTPSPTPSASPSASPSPSPTPKAKPSPSPSKHTAAAPAHIASGAKKGVGVWSFGGVSQALAASGASWYYTWSTQHSGITTPSSGSFVPMIWGAKSVTDSSLAQAREYGPYLLGFNEPDMAQQSNMTVEQALELWPKLMAAGKILGSPAVAYGGDTAGGWLDRFMSGARAKGYRVDFITLHWYGGDFRTPQAVEQLKSYLAAVYARYHKPIWLTEYALIDFSQGTRFPSARQQADFVTASTKALDGLSYVQRYAWFGLGADPSKPSSGLFTDGTTTTAAGRAFQSAD